ncbi:MAG: hypothetical protein COV36_06590 [Alphaproteobacteria bacterium CG11_big_fil_rev_8_21_14_0_20_44_7]|nr:MAG: hypothetical protein COV36_06590 [Alphaproteobacteria bacterium CG11_big_fil_rev_8_21_14_0_20_44_7]
MELLDPLVAQAFSATKAYVAQAAPYLRTEVEGILFTESSLSKSREGKLQCPATLSQSLLSRSRVSTLFTMEHDLYKAAESAMRLAQREKDTSFRNR